MSTQPYLIKPGDTLIGIGIEHNVDFTTLLTLNPQYQSNPDLIVAGETLQLPVPQETKPAETDFPVEPVTAMCVKEKGSLTVPPLCAAKEIEDVVFATGEPANHYYCLTAEAIEKLDQEIEQTQTLFECYQEVVSGAPKGDQAWAEIEKHAEQRQALCEKLIYAGVLPAPKTNNRASVRAEQRRKEKRAKEKALENQRRANAKVTEIKNRIHYIKAYDHWYGTQDSTDKLKAHLINTVIPNLESELAKWEPLAKLAVKPQTPYVKSVDLARSGKTKETRLDGIVNRSGVRELYSINRGVYLYIREAFFERETRIRNSWMTLTSTTRSHQALTRGDTAALGKAIADDITKDASKKLVNPDLKANLWKWQAPGGKLAEWETTSSLLRNSEGNTMFAVSAEAQLCRWGMQAAVDAQLNPFNKDENGNANAQVDLGVGVQAAFSVFEAAVGAELFLPSDAGYTPCLSYKDANGQDATHSFGSFRFNAKVKLGCFVGVNGQARLSAGNGRPEVGDDVGILFDPSVTMGNTNGQIGFRAGIFGGGQLSGEFSGGVQWKEPPTDTTTYFRSLAEVSLEGNVSVGGGYNADFILHLERGQFFLKVSAKLVWGVGGGAGFAIAIDGQTIWQLAKVVWQGLQYIDYRQLSNIAPKAYEYLVDATYLAFTAVDTITSPANALEFAVSAGEGLVNKIKARREDSLNLEKEAIVLAERVLDDSTRSGVPFNQLPPEAVGRMLDTLTRTFIFNWEEKQEQAICKLLQESTYSWHKFEEILARMNPTGSKVSGEKALFNSIERINAILDNKQQAMFNRWVATLTEVNLADKVAQAPFVAYQHREFTQKQTQIEQQYASLYGNATSYPYV
ncbi:LysM peptidoglycan-binding domain-containing protein [Vibrio neptunius]|uniref:LysM peptidoglycan-binding domain-containing protein n=1 Tax=Vibrio neptunius TaxID=170651 RepID=UPI003CE5AB7E